MDDRNRSSPRNRQEEKYVERMCYLLDSGEGSDVGFAVGTEGQTTLFPVHKAILCACSDVFLAMFCGALKTVEVVICVPDINPHAFRKMLLYIYTGATSFDNLDEAFQVLYASKKYMLIPLSTQCRKYIAQNLAVTNVCSMFELVTSVTEEEELRDQCLQFICNNTSEIMKDISFVSLSPASLDVILDQDNLLIDSEIDVVYAVLRWACEECVRCELSTTSQNKRYVLRSALKRIRFFTLTPEEYAEVSNICDFLTPEEDSVILSNITHCKVTKVSPNLSCNFERRLTAPKSCPQCRRTHKPVPSNRSGSQITFGAVRGAFGQSAYSNASVFGGALIRTNMSCPYCGYVYTKFRDL